MTVSSRRSFLSFGIKVTVAGAAAATLSACGSKQAASASACVDVDSLTASEHSLRESMHYVEKAPNPAESCAGCEFFTADPGGGACGTCQMFVGGPANPTGHCDSWAAKPA